MKWLRLLVLLAAIAVLGCSQQTVSPEPAPDDASMTNLSPEEEAAEAAQTPPAE